jgi:hypothetical protein
MNSRSLLCALALAACQPTPAPQDGDAGIDDATMDAASADAADGALVADASLMDSPALDADALIDGGAMFQSDGGAMPEGDGDAGRAPTDAAADDGDAGHSADVTLEAGPACPTSFREIVLPSGSVTAILGDSTGSTNDRFTCATSLLSSERIFDLRVASRTGLTLSTNNAFTNVDTAIAVRRVCDNPSTEFACADNAPGGVAGTSVLRAVFEPGSYSVIVDAKRASGGTFQLNWSTFAPAANATCETASPLTAGVTTMGTTENGGASTPIACGTWFAEQSFYSINVPANSRLQVSLRNLGTTLVSAYYSDSCTDRFCGGGTTATLGATSTATYDNNTSFARTITVGVGTESMTAHAVFSLTPSITPLARNANCALPTPLTVGAVEAGDTASGGAPPLGCALSEQRGQFFSAVVPARSRATFTIRSVTSQQVRTRVLDSCTAGSCVQSALNNGFAQQDMIVENTSGADRTYLLQIGSVASTSTAQFTVHYVGTQSVAPNAVCTSPRDINVGETVVGDTRGGASTAVCRASRELYYRVAVPANSQAILELTRGATQNVEAVAFESCSTATCANLVATTSASLATLRLQNPTAAPRTQTFSVASTSFLAPTTFSLRFDRISAFP